LVPANCHSWPADIGTNQRPVTLSQ
jgi:hypothetical protein